MSGSNNAARIQGAGANCTDGDPVNVCATAALPVNVVSGGGGGGPVTVADCADVTQGCIADAAVTGDNPGTVNAHLRGIDTILNDVWVQSDGTLSVEQTDFFTTGVLAAPGDTVVNTLDGKCGAGIRLGSGGVGTVVVEGAVVAGGTFVRLCYFVDGRNADTNDLQVSGGVTLTVPAAGFNQVRVRAVTWTSGTSNVTIRSNSTSLSVVEGSRPQSDLMVSGNITAFNQAVNLPLFGCGSCMIKISGTWTGTLAIEADCGNGVFQNWHGSSVSPANFEQISTSQNATYICVTAGLKSIQMRASAFSSGTAVVNIQGCQATPAFIPQFGYPAYSANTQLQDIGNLFNSCEYGSDASIILGRSITYARGSSNIVLVRTPDVFKTVQAINAGNTALWTPAAGKRFRIMRFLVQVTENATQAVAGVITITFKDGAAGVINLDQDVWVPGAALAAAGDLYNSGWIDIGNGIISTAFNNILNVNLSAALTAGNVRVTMCGIEE